MLGTQSERGALLGRPVHEAAGEESGWHRSSGATPVTQMLQLVWSQVSGAAHFRPAPQLPSPLALVESQPLPEPGVQGTTVQSLLFASLHLLLLDAFGELQVNPAGQGRFPVQSPPIF